MWAGSQNWADSAHSRKNSAWGRLGGAQGPILYTGANHTLVVYTVAKTHPSLFLTYKLELGWFLVAVYTSKV